MGSSEATVCDSSFLHPGRRQAEAVHLPFAPVSNHRNRPIFTLSMPHLAGQLQNLQSSKLLGNSHLIGEHLTKCGAFLSIQPWDCAGHALKAGSHHDGGQLWGLRPSACPSTIVTPVQLGTGTLSGVTPGPNPWTSLWTVGHRLGSGGTLVTPGGLKREGCRRNVY